MASRDCSGIWRVLVVWCMFFCASLILTAPGVRAFKFLKNPPQFLLSYVGRNLDFSCATDDPNATVSLWHSSNFMTWTEKLVTPNKLDLRGQVFTLLNLVLLDGGQYRCKATSQSGQTIQSSAAFVFVDAATLPDHFELIPDKNIYVLQGQDGAITCECEGTSIATLKWEKQTSDKTSYAAVPNSWVTNTEDSSTNKLKAVLKITNAQLGDSGLYKCTVSVKPNKSDFKLTNIRVNAPTAPTIEPYKEETVMKEESTKIIKCVAKGSPKPKVTWYRNGKMLNTTNCVKDRKSCENVVYEVYEEGDDPSGLHTIYTVQVLKIRSVLYPRDIAEFKCVASNGVSPDDEIIINLDVQVAPRIRRQIDPPVLEESKEGTVSCKLDKGNPLPTFKWQYAFQNLGCEVSDSSCSPSENQWKTIPSQLMITPTATPTNESIVRVESHQENTFYRCQAFNKLGNDSQVLGFVRLVKEKDPIEIDAAKTVTEYNEESTMHVYCIERSGGFLRVLFTKDGQKLLSADDSRVNVTVEKKTQQESLYTLTVKNLTVNDTGNYGCTTYLLYPVILRSINITIKPLVATSISDIPDQNVRQVEQGGIVQLLCQTTGNPKPSITWYFYKDGKGDREQVNKENNDLGGNSANCKNRKNGYYYLFNNDRSRLVICNPEFEQNQGKYQCHASNKAGSMDKYAFVNVEMVPVIIEPVQGYTTSLDIEDTLNITCKAKGNPSPNITWIKNSTGEIVAASTTNSKQLTITAMKEEDFGVYSCIASNNLKSTEVSVDIIKVGSVEAAKGDGLSTGALVGIAIGVGVFVLIVLVACCCLYRRQKKQIDEYKKIYFLQQSDYKIDPDRSLLEQCNDLPYDPDWEFPEERLILGEVLGAGAFGQVVQAEAIGILALNPRDKSAESFKRRSKIRRSSRAKDLKKEDGGAGWKNLKVPVAVKTLKEGATQAEYKDLASELKILIHLGQHKNIVNLLGACTRGKRLMVIMEFAPHGSLLSFLRDRRNIYEANWAKTVNDPDKEFTLVDLVMIGFQVARGLSFLGSKKCVHRDVAARNVLVGYDYVMKIADFGLARDIYKDDLYVKKTQGLLPVKWMAPESLFDRVYTEKTDVWSFGILLWETFTLGGNPYPGLPTEQLLDYLSEGKRMDMPAKCPLEVYTIMRDCWNHDADDRPHFTTLAERLAKILEKNSTTENPYLALVEEELDSTSQGYYLQPCDDAGIRQSKRYVKSPVHSPTSDVDKPSNFGDADKQGDGMGYDSPLPTVPPGDDDIPKEPLPPLPPSYENATRRESGIDMDGLDDGYVDDVGAPFLPRPGNEPVAIEMDKVSEAKLLIDGKTQKIETAF